MTTPWKTEEEEPIGGVPIQLQLGNTPAATAHNLENFAKQKISTTYVTKASLVLVDSDKETWGIVEDTLGDLLWQPGKGEVVGTWSRPGYDNLIHMSVGTSLSVLQDRSTQTFAAYAEQRRQSEAGVKKPRKSSKKAAAEASEPLPEISVDEKLKFNSLRARLGRAK